jgi:hypothetical protein
MADQSHSLDIFIVPRASHNLSAWIQASPASHVNLAIDTIFPANPTYLVNLGLDAAAPGTSFVNLAMDVVSKDQSFVNLGLSVANPTESYVKLGLTGMLGGVPSHNLSAVVALPNTSFVRLGMTVIQLLQADTLLKFPDSSFVKLDMWAVSSVRGKASIQVPGGNEANDFLSSDVAKDAYPTMGLIQLDGINLIITSFIAGVISYQTRTKQWMRRVDEAAGGIVTVVETNKHTDAVGHTIITTTTRKQVQDTNIVTVKTEDLGSSVIAIEVIETSKSGKETKREISTTTENGIKHTKELKTVTSKPPVRENRQPIKVRNLAGIEFYQWFGAPNEEWAGGEEEGTTSTATDTQIVPSSLNGQTTDSFGNPILARITDQTVTKPTGEVLQTHTEEIGIRDVGTTVTDTDSEFQGIQTKSTTTTTYPDGSQQIVVTVTNNLTGDSLQVDTTTATSETGQVTITTVTTETKTFDDPVTGQVRTTTTKTTNRTIDGVVTEDVTTTTSNDFEDSIINDKIKVFLVQEFTITCIIDWISMQALQELFTTHQMGYARLELYGQQLGNASLSWLYRQKLITQYNQAMDQIRPVPLLALGKSYNVVFAPSASSFRAKYITGTSPNVFELQMIVQQRSDITTGAWGF